MRHKYIAVIFFYGVN